MKTVTDKEKIEALREQLQKVYIKLHGWANESVTGGWSTHQVEPQKKLASEVAETLYRTSI